MEVVVVVTVSFSEFTCCLRISVFFSRTSRLVRLSWMEMQVSIIFLNSSHSVTISSLSLVISSLRMLLSSIFLVDSSWTLCLNLISSASFSNLMVSMVSSR